ncbi:hypothetical protein HDU76_000581, partial [Blyttiomyces sp. JEL0837]
KLIAPKDVEVPKVMEEMTTDPIEEVSKTGSDSNHADSSHEELDEEEHDVKTNHGIIPEQNQFTISPMFSVVQLQTETVAVAAEPDNVDVVCKEQQGERAAAVAKFDHIGVVCAEEGDVVENRVDGGLTLDNLETRTEVIATPASDRVNSTPTKESVGLFKLTSKLTPVTVTSEVIKAVVKEESDELPSQEPVEPHQFMSTLAPISTSVTDELSLPNVVNAGTNGEATKPILTNTVSEMLTDLKVDIPTSPITPKIATTKVDPPVPTPTDVVKPITKLAPTPTEAHKPITNQTIKPTQSVTIQSSPQSQSKPKTSEILDNQKAEPVQQCDPTPILTNVNISEVAEVLTTPDSPPRPARDRRRKLRNSIPSISTTGVVSLPAIGSYQGNLVSSVASKVEIPNQLVTGYDNAFKLPRLVPPTVLSRELKDVEESNIASLTANVSQSYESTKPSETSHGDISSQSIHVDRIILNPEPTHDTVEEPILVNVASVPPENTLQQDEISSHANQKDEIFSDDEGPDVPKFNVNEFLKVDDLEDDNDLEQAYKELTSNLESEFCASDNNNPCNLTAHQKSGSSSRVSSATPKQRRSAKRRSRGHSCISKTEVRSAEPDGDWVDTESDDDETQTLLDLAPLQGNDDNSSTTTEPMLEHIDIEIKTLNTSVKPESANSADTLTVENQSPIQVFTALVADGAVASKSEAIIQKRTLKNRRAIRTKSTLAASTFMYPLPVTDANDDSSNDESDKEIMKIWKDARNSGRLTSQPPDDKPVLVVSKEDYSQRSTPMTMSVTDYSEVVPSPKKTPNKSIHLIMRNALAQVCFPGSANEEYRSIVMKAIQMNPSNHFIILLRGTKNHGFQGIYSFNSGTSDKIDRQLSAKQQHNGDLEGLLIV